MNAILQTFYRIFGGAILCFFAFVPAWVGIHLAPSLIDPAERQIVSLLVALAVCISLTYFLGLLAYPLLRDGVESPTAACCHRGP